MKEEDDFNKCDFCGTVSEDVYFWREVVTHNVASDCNDYLEEEEWQKAQDALSKITKDQKYYVPEQ